MGTEVEMETKITTSDAEIETEEQEMKTQTVDNRLLERSTRLAELLWEDKNVLRLSILGYCDIRFADFLVQLQDYSFGPRLRLRERFLDLRDEPEFAELADSHLYCFSAEDVFPSEIFWVELTRGDNNGDC